MAKQFDGKLVLVAGGTGGLGRAVSLAFLGESAQVVVTYRNENEFSALKQTTAARTSLSGYQVDVTDEVAVSQLVKDIVAASGRLDVMVNAVGAYAGGTPVWQTDSAVFDRMMALNLRSGYVLSRHVVPQMLKQRSGSIVSVSSQAAAADHAAGAGAYAASKAAAVALFDSLAADLKGTGVRANSVLPSIIDTDANRKAIPDADFSKWPKPEDIAKVILFLCGEDAKLVHGASVPVYGAF